MNKFWGRLLNAEKAVVNQIKHIAGRFEYEIEDLPGGDMHVQNFYSPKAILPQGQSSNQLEGWFSQYHPRYNMSSWCFFGNIKDETGKIAAINSIVQYQQLPNQTPYIAEWSYCDDHTDGYALAPFMVEETNVEYSRPFAVTVDANPIYGGLISFALDSGQMGTPSARYKITGRVVALPDLLDVWEYELAMTDTFGCIQVGYGPSSFLPQWLTPSQHSSIISDYNGNVHQYLQKGHDGMLGQGSYYYSIPLLKVDRFNITKNGQPYFSGVEGNMWMDYVVQSFNQDSLVRLKTATWQFFAIQLPEISSKDGLKHQAAMMISIVDTTQADKKSTLPMARFYCDVISSKQAKNESRAAYFEWSIDQISFKVSETWKTSPIAFTISLESPHGHIHLNGKAIRKNQLVSEVEKYEGVFTVTADVSLRDFEIKDVKGFAWGEVH